MKVAAETLQIRMLLSMFELARIRQCNQIFVPSTIVKIQLNFRPQLFDLFSISKPTKGNQQESVGHAPIKEEFSLNLMMKGQDQPPPLPSFLFVSVNFVQSVILEAVENKSLLRAKHARLGTPFK